MADDKSFLRSVLLFKDLPDVELAKIVSFATEKKFPRHQIVCEEGEQGNSLFIIKQGLVKISKASSDGRIKTLAILKPGEFFGEMSLLSDEKRSATGETLNETRVLVLDKVNFHTLLNKNPHISIQIIRTLIERLSQADRQIKNLALGNSRAKVADILLFLAEHFGNKEKDKAKTKVNIKLTHQEIADLAGLARETTTKLLNEFVKDDAITLADKEIEITDVAKLREWVL
jgi:CRP/FNR family transcriptional regulator, cyclic AMP receptor protein